MSTTTPTAAQLETVQDQKNKMLSTFKEKNKNDKFLLNIHQGLLKCHICLGKLDEAEETKKKILELEKWIKLDSSIIEDLESGILDKSLTQIISDENSGYIPL